MSLLTLDFKHDIYISYRRNQQIFEWTKEFVNILKTEVEQILKESISIFFENGLDYSPENVNSTLFIPIISNSYCDANKDNWKNELQYFKNSAVADSLGFLLPFKGEHLLSRILPIKINSISDAEYSILEGKTDGRLKSIDFIFDAIEGVSRPLRPNDDVTFKTGTLLYRNQIIKTANIIAELLLSAKNKLKGIDIQSENNKNTVFLAWTPNDCKKIRDDLAIVLEKAGMNVVPIYDCPSKDSDFNERVNEAIKKSDCSVHILGGKVGNRQINNLPISLNQIEEAKKILTTNSDYKIFIWNNLSSFYSIEPEQQKIINDIRNNIINKMIFTNIPSPVQLVDDIRTMLASKEEKETSNDQHEVFFMYNFLDEDNADEIKEMLSDILPVEALIVGEDQSLDYGQVSVRLIKSSKLAVIFYSEAGTWAIPFVQQIWKMIGGASSRTPILFIGDKENVNNIGKAFIAPNVISKLIQKNFIPFEIKATYDNIVEGNL